MAAIYHRLEVADMSAAKDLMALLQSEHIGDVVPKGYYTVRQLAKSANVSESHIQRRLKSLGCKPKKFRVNGFPVPHYSL